jgi:hypothetical protein
LTITVTICTSNISIAVVVHGVIADFSCSGIDVGISIVAVVVALDETIWCFTSCGSTRGFVSKTISVVVGEEVLGVGSLVVDCIITVVVDTVADLSRSGIDICVTIVTVNIVSVTVSVFINRIDAVFCIDTVAVGAVDHTVVVVVDSIIADFVGWGWSTSISSVSGVITDTVEIVSRDAVPRDTSFLHTAACDGHAKDHEQSVNCTHGILLFVSHDR